MSKLKAAIEEKKRKIQEEQSLGGVKYRRKGDIEQEKIERELQKKQELKENIIAEEKKDQQEVQIIEDKQSSETEGKIVQTPRLSSEEVIKRLRSKEQPIRLFAETDDQREERLRIVEAQDKEASDTEFTGQRNDFHDELEQINKDETEDTPKEKPIDEDFIPINYDPVKHTSEEFILFKLQTWMRDWEIYMDDRPEIVKKSASGKLQTATFMQTQKYIKPLFHQLRVKSCPDDIINSVNEIVQRVDEKRIYESK